MDMENRSWMNLPRWTEEYSAGVNYFLDKAFAKVAQGREISCPCKNCCHRFWFRRNVVYDHLIAIGFTPGYYVWYFHGEGLSSSSNVNNSQEDIEQSMHDDIHGLLHDTFRDAANEPTSSAGVGDGPTNEAKKFYKLVEEGQQELYPGSKNFSTLSFTIRLYLFKCLHGLSNVAFTDLLELLKEAFPDARIPKSFNQAKNMVKELGLDYTKIHACPNDCMLFSGDYTKATHCHICGASRWKLDEVHQENDATQSSAKAKQIPAKVLRYFPLKPRLKRLFMCEETAIDMQWHANERPRDGNLRHPADGQAWKDFDSLHPNFAKDPRNVRLGLASDGFNPFRTMSIGHSTWPVVLINYNLSPWICTKPEYMMLSMIIPGPNSPGREIDVFLQPLIDELKELWEFGTETYDAYSKQSFQMHAGLLWTISDFPAYAMLSGWSTKGKLACPCCNYETCSRYLKYSRKTCYLDHRRFLDSNHPWRFDKESFNGSTELRSAPIPLSGMEALAMVSDFNNSFGKKQKKKKRDILNPWRKRSVFFELPYWKHNMCRHNLDVMHIEKNVFDNVLGTLLDIPGKTKDHANARFDLQDMGIRRELQPILSDDQRHIFLAKASFSMTVKEKELFCSVLRNAKLPQGCASNISRCVHVEERKVFGYKSHDAHFMMHYLLQVAVRKTLPKHVAFALIRLGDFFRGLCSKVINPQDLHYLKTEIIEILCQLEKIFPPCFFDIMMHLPIHLVDEIKLGGPVHCRWMFSIERYLCKLKSYVRNKSQPEGSIAEGYLAEECLTFCSRYMHDGVKTRFSRYVVNNDKLDDHSSPIFLKLGHPIGCKRKRKGKAFTMDNLTKSQAHRYVLFNCGDEEVENYIREHQNLMNRQTTSRWAKAQSHSQDFITWFHNKVMNFLVPNHIKWLSNGPNPVAKRYSGYFVNGYRFHTRERDSRCKTQNSGVTLSALTNSFSSSKDQNPIMGEVIYYGAITEIFEIDYWGQFSVVLFRCDWFDVGKDGFGLTRVNFNKKCYLNDPFVLASQVLQVFYLADPTEKEIYYVMKKVPRDLFDLIEERTENVQATYWGEPSDICSNRHANVDIQDVNWSREDVPGTTFAMSPNTFVPQPNLDESDGDSEFDDTDWDWMDSQ